MDDKAETGYIIREHYIDGTDGTLRLFFRPEGAKYHLEGFGEMVQREPAYIVQFGGSPTYDSGYAQYHFETEDEAQRKFDDKLRSYWIIDGAPARRKVNP